MREHTTLRMELESAPINTGFTKDLGRAGQRKPMPDAVKLYIRTATILLLAKQIKRSCVAVAFLRLTVDFSEDRTDSDV